MDCIGAGKMRKRVPASYVDVHSNNGGQMESEIGARDADATRIGLLRGPEFEIHLVYTCH